MTEKSFTTAGSNILQNLIVGEGSAVALHIRADRSAGDAHEIAARHRTVRIGEAHVIEEIERLETELEPGPLLVPLARLAEPTLSWSSAVDRCTFSYSLVLSKMEARTGAVRIVNGARMD